MRDLTGMRWVGRTDVAITGFENLGAGFMGSRAQIAITSFRHRQNRREWIVTSQRRVAMDGDLPVWLGASSVRVADHDHAVKRRDYGLLRAQRAWRITPEGAFTPIDEPVVCNEEGHVI